MVCFDSLSSLLLAPLHRLMQGVFLCAAIISFGEEF